MSKHVFPSKDILNAYADLGLDNRQSHLLFFAGILPQDYRALKVAPFVNGETIVPNYKKMR